MKTILLLLAITLSAIPVSAGSLMGLSRDPISREIIETHRMGQAETAPGKAQDILWVIDNSGSMAEHHEALRAPLQAMFTALQAQRLPWKMGFITTDANTNPTVSEITPATPNGAATLDHFIVGLGTAGSGTEEPLRSIAQNLAQNTGFLTANSDLTIIIVTDAMEQSPATVENYLLHLRVAAGNRAVYSQLFVAPTDFGCAPVAEDPWNFAGSRYEQWNAGMNGSVVSSLCADLNAPMAAAAQTIVDRSLQDGSTAPQPPATSEFVYLSERADPATIVVTYDGQTVPMGFPTTGKWMYDAQKNALWFHDLSFLIPGDDKIQVRYTEIAD